MIAMITTGTAARKGGVMLITTDSSVATRQANRQVGLTVGTIAVVNAASTIPMATPATWGHRVNTRRATARATTKATSAPTATTRAGAATIEITMAITTGITIGTTARTTAAGTAISNRTA